MIGRFRPFRPFASRLIGGGGAGVPATFAALFPDGTTGGVWPAFGGGLFVNPGVVVPASVGDPISRALDPSQGVSYSGGVFSGAGAQRVVNGGFDTDTNWFKGFGVTISGGTANFSGANQSLAQTGVFPLAEGGLFEVKANLVSMEGVGAYIVRCGTFASGDSRYATQVTFPGEYTMLLGAAGGNTDLNTSTNPSTVSAVVDNVSVKPLPGNHAVQATTADKMVLSETAGGVLYFDNQGVATKTLEAFLPAGDYYPLSVAPDGTVTTNTMISHAGGYLDVVSGEANMAALRDTAWGAADLAIVERLYQQQGG